MNIRYLERLLQAIASMLHVCTSILQSLAMQHHTIRTGPFLAVYDLCQTQLGTVQSPTYV